MTKTSLQRRSWLRQAGWVGSTTLAGAAGLLGIIGRVLAAGDTTALQGMRRLVGEVTINGRPARADARVNPGDSVETGAGAEAVYVIGRDAFLQRANSRVSFGDSAAAGVLRVVTGRLLSVFDRGQRRIETPTAIIGIRGTGCYIEAAAARVYFCLCYGEAELIPTVSPQEKEVYRTRHHDRPMYIYSDMAMPKMAVPAEVINHTDAELVLLEALVGRQPPFQDYGKY